MTRPASLWGRLKYHFWNRYTPYHPYVRDALVSLRIVSHSGRQNYLLGTIVPGKTVQELVSFLISRGYGNHFVAWKDDGELVGLRYAESFERQYHLRIFADGEVRGHYEYTTEHRPVRHYRAIGQEARREEFLDLLDGWISPSHES